MKIQVRHKNVYGKELVYPACEKAETFARIANKKTLDNSDLAKIKTLGFEVERIF